MGDFILLMHSDTQAPESGEAWERYLTELRASGAFDGGSAIGEGLAVRKSGTAGTVSRHITGYLRVRAVDIEDAKRFLPGNPVFEHGGTVEIRALPND